MSYPAKGAVAGTKKLALRGLGQLRKGPKRLGKGKKHPTPKFCYFPVSELSEDYVVVIAEDALTHDGVANGENVSKYVLSVRFLTRREETIRGVGVGTSLGLSATMTWA